MSRRRYVSTTISLDRRVNKLAQTAGDFAALLYTWTIPAAEDDGSFPEDAEELAMLVLPGRREKSFEDVMAARDAIVALGLWEKADDGRLRFPATSFYR